MTEAAGRIFRSQSATSLQIARLEQVLGAPVFLRHGRGVRLTRLGERLLPVARQVTETLSDTLRTLTADSIHGTLRLGIPDDESMTTLARIIGEFSRAHPLVELELTCALSAGFPAALARGALDLAVYEVQHPPVSGDVLRQEPTSWMVSRRHDVLGRDPLPVALFDQDCWWQQAALDSLQASGRRYRVVCSSQSVLGVSAAIEAGMAIGLLGQSSLTPTLRCLGQEDGFDEMPVSRLILGRRPGAEGAAIDAMAAAIRQAFAG